jgi:hypothetical protein
MLRGIKERLLAIVLLFASGATLLTLTMDEKSSLRADMQAIVTIAADPSHEQYTEAQSLLPVVEKLCPTCELPAKTHCRMASDPGFTCHKGLKYGSGVGGVDRRGVPISCICTGEDRRMPEVLPSGDEDKDLTRYTEEELFRILKDRLN